MPSHVYVLCTHWMTVITSLNVNTFKKGALTDSLTDEHVSYEKGQHF